MCCSQVAESIVSVVCHSDLSDIIKWTWYSQNHHKIAAKKQKLWSKILKKMAAQLLIKLCNISYASVQLLSDELSKVSA